MQRDSSRTLPPLDWITWLISLQDDFEVWNWPTEPLRGVSRSPSDDAGEASVGRWEGSTAGDTRDRLWRGSGNAGTDGKGRPR